MRRLLRGIGWSFIGLGCFVLYFLVYQLVGTDVATNRAQASLRQELNREWSAATPAKRGQVRTTPVAAKLGAPIALLEIPKIELKNVVVVQGINRAQLARGPGHFPSTVMAGEPGTFGIAGHRTTHSRPFYQLDALAKGDTIRVATKEAVYTYTVTYSKVVKPSQTEVLDNVRGPDGRLKPQIMLQTCHPRYSASNRLIVFGELTHTAANPGRLVA